MILTINEEEKLIRKTILSLFMIYWNKNNWSCSC